MPDSDDETVNGPKVAAEILKRLPQNTQERLVRSISQVSPNIAQKIKENYFGLKDIPTLTPQSIQLVIGKIEHKDLVLSLKTVSDEVKYAFLNNMSSRKQQMTENDLSSLPPVKLSDVELAQQRLLATIDQLRSAGLLRTQSPNDVWV